MKYEMTMKHYETMFAIVSECVRCSDDVAEPSGGFFPALNTGGSLVAFSVRMELRLYPAGRAQQRRVNRCCLCCLCEAQSNVLQHCSIESEREVIKGLRPLPPTPETCWVGFNHAYPCIEAVSSTRTCFRDVSGYSDVPRRMSKAGGLSWFFKVFMQMTSRPPSSWNACRIQVNSGEFRWIQVNSGEFRWIQVNWGEFRWIEGNSAELMHWKSNEVRWSQVKGQKTAATNRKMPN